MRSGVALTDYIGVNIEVIKRSLKNFAGIQRRMTKVLKHRQMIFSMIMLIIQQKLCQF